MFPSLGDRSNWLYDRSRQRVVIAPSVEKERLCRSSSSTDFTLLLLLLLETVSNIISFLENFLGEDESVISMVSCISMKDTSKLFIPKIPGIAGRN